MLKFHLAKRYLIGKKSTNAIHVITGISMVGLSVGTAALIIILSVFNGFQDLLMSFFNNFNPPLKVSPVVGKTFIPDEDMVSFLENHPDVKAFSFTLEELSLFEYNDRLEVGIIKGVDEYYQKVTTLETTLTQGRFVLREEGTNRAVAGAGMARKLGINVADQFSALTVYMPDRRATAFDQPFKSRLIRPVGVFAVHSDVDQEYILAPMEFVRDLLGEEEGVSYLEIAAHSESGINRIQREMLTKWGDDFHIRNQYQQDEAFYRIMQIEKWVSFAIVSLTLILVAFNLVGALWMIVLEKKRDISILKAMGADSNFIKNVFFTSGLLIGIGGMIIGVILALLFYFLQTNFGLIPVPHGFIVESYPISLRWYDFVVVAITVSIIGLLGSIWPAIKASGMEVSLKSD